MRTLNVRFAVILLVGSIFLAGGVHLLHYIQINHHASAILAAAEDAKKKDDLGEALRRLYNYLSLEPNDLDAREKQGLWLAEGGNDAAAYVVLEELLRSEGMQDRTDARRKLIDVAMKVGRWTDAESHLKYLIDQHRADHPSPAGQPSSPDKSPENAELAELLALLGRCKVVMGQDQEAVKCFQESIKLQPTVLEPYMYAAQLLRIRLDRPKDADNLMAEMVRVNEKSAKAHVFYGSYFFELDSTNKAMKEAAEALKIDPKELTALFLAGRCAVDQEKFDVAEGYANRSIEVAPENPDGYRLLAEIKSRSGHRDEAVKVLKKGLEATKKTKLQAYGGLLWYVANMQLDSGNAAEAKSTIDEMERIKYRPEAHLDCLKARLEQSKGNWQAARVMYEKVRPDLANTPAFLKYVDFWIGLCYGQMGNIEQQLAAYRRAVALDPSLYAARLGIAEILSNSGDLDGAIQEYRQALKAGRRNAQISLALCRALVIKTLKQSPAERNWDEVNQALEAARKLAPNSVDLQLFRAEILMARNRVDDAERTLLNLRNAVPDRPEAWLSLAALAERQEKWEQADKYLQDAEKKLGDQVAIRLARGQYLLRRYGPEAGPQLKKLSENCEKMSDAEQVRLWNGLVLHLIQVNDLESAQKLCLQIAKKDPRNIRIRQVMFEMACKSQDATSILPELERLLGEIEAVSGKGPFWLYGRAAWLTLQAKKHPEMLDEAERCLVRAREMRPTWARLPRLAGRVNELQGEVDKAIADYVEAINLGERDPDIIRSTVQLMFKRQRFSDADALLRRMAEQQAIMSGDIYRIWTQIAMQQGDSEMAAKTVAKAIREDSKNFNDYLWLGRVYGMLALRAKEEGKPQVEVQQQEMSEKALRRALELEPKSPDCWVALVQLLASAGQKQKARDVVAQAQRDIPWPQSALAMAHCYEALGDTDMVKEKYKVALTAIPDNSLVIRHAAEFYLRINDFAQAEPLVKSLIDGKGKFSDSDISWARQTEALILRQRGGFANLTEAVRLIDQNLASSSASAQDRRVKARLLLADPRRAKNQEAIEILEQSIQSGETVSPEDYFGLAQLYRGRGDWAKYRAHMLKCLGGSKPNPQHVVAHIRTLLQNGEDREAEFWLERAEKAIPDKFTKISFHGEILVVQGKVDQALTLISGFVDEKDLAAKERSERTLLAASALELWADRLTKGVRAPGASGVKAVSAADKVKGAELAQKAEAMYRSYVQQKPKEELVLAGFLARQGRVKESLDVIDRSWSDVDPAVLAMAAWTVLRGGNASPDDMPAMQKILESALKKFNRPASLLMPTAYCCSVQGRYKEAEGFYREVLAKDPNNATAMNDLAVLLSLQGKGLDEAIKLVDRAIEITGPLGAMLDSRAMVFIAMEQPDKALADIEAAVADEASPVRLFHQARAYALAGRKSDAAESMKAATQAGLKRSMLDHAEQPVFDKLQTEL